MRHLLFVLAFGLLTSFRPEEGEFYIHVSQDGKDATYNDAGELELEKKPFKIQVRMRNLEGVYLHAGFTDSLYKLTPKDTIPGFKDIPPNVMAEESFNKEQELLIDAESWAYWFFDPNLDWHRFDKDVWVQENLVTANKTIRQLHMVGAGKTIPIAEIKDPLYLFFFSVQPSDDGSEMGVELQRNKIKIVWK
jgi:hypothetical protein